MIQRYFQPAVIGLLLTACPALHAAFPTVALKPVVLQQIHSPTNITYPPDGSGRVFVCDQMGKIFIIERGMMRPVPFLDLSPSGQNRVIAVTTGYSERGLLGMAFHPDYATIGSPGFGRFYVYYSAPGTRSTANPASTTIQNNVSVLAEYQVSPTNPNIALTTEREMLTFGQPQSNHNGGQLEFGPDGMLYLGTGDGGGSNDNNAGHTGGSTSFPTNNLGNSLDRTNYLGKIFRINPLDPDGAGPLTYSIPNTNPFFNDATPGLKKEIYAFGLRNPWRFSFDKRPGGSNRLFCGDVGQGRIEEINLITSGANYGWRYREGHEAPTFSSGATTNPMGDPLSGPYIAPIASYAHPGVTTTAPVLPQLGLSVTGGYVYRGSAIPALQGKYVFGDYGATSGTTNGRIMGLEETASPGIFTLTQAIPLLGLANPVVGRRILCLGEDASGEIYIGMKTKGGVLELDGGLPSGGIYKIIPVESNTAALQPEKDNTLFSEDATLAQHYSDGRGYLYAGRTGSGFGPYVRRALIAFDVAANIPSGAVINTAQLKLNLNKIGPSGSGATLELHRLNQTWGEGTSVNPVNGGFGAPATANDATWFYRFFNSSLWATAGGDFQAVPTASSLAAYGLVTWGSNAAMISDVQGWLNTPSTNAGWILRGDEFTDESACRFDSAQLGNTAPALALTYQATAPPAPFEQWLQTYYPANLVGQFVDPKGDDEGDGILNLFEYAYGTNPTIHDASSDFSMTVAPSAIEGTDLILTFRRNFEATDLLFKLQTSPDLIDWSTTIAESVNGAFATALNGAEIVSENYFDGSANLVTVRLNFPGGLPASLFTRLRVSWQ